ncbi:MAG: ATP-binding protein, partial [Bryobacteraceae bacterium]
MHYKRFVIRNYRAITGPLEINVEKKPLAPIIGVNESGKTTILHAILAFDYFNDHLNDGGRHLKDIANLYRTSSPMPVVEAQIEIRRIELDRAISSCAEQHVPLRPHLAMLRKKRALPTTPTIRRNLKTMSYSWDSNRFG